jgi:phage-related protein
MKDIEFCGDSLRILRAFPDPARSEAGKELFRVQMGLDPNNWKPFPTIGPGVREIRVRESKGAFRIIYLATLPEAVYVLHAFQKKKQKTPQRDIDLAKARLGELRKRGVT